MNWQVETSKTSNKEGQMRERRLGKVGTIRREILGKACRLCGGRTYQVIFRSGVSNLAGLSAQCTHCQRPRKLDEDLGRILWV